MRVSVACTVLLLADETRTARLMSGTGSRGNFRARKTGRSGYTNNV